MGRPGCRQYAFADLFYRDAAGEIFKLRDEDVAFGPPSARSQGQKNAFHRHKRPGGRVAARADELAA